MNISVSRNWKAEILSNKHKIITLILLLFAWTTLEKKSHDNTFHFKSSLQQLKITCWFDVFQQQYDTKNEKQEPAAHTAHALRSWMFWVKRFSHRSHNTYTTLPVDDWFTVIGKMRLYLWCCQLLTIIKLFYVSNTMRVVSMLYCSNILIWIGIYYLFIQ